MAKEISREEARLLLEMEKLGNEGKNFAEIAEALERPYHGLRSLLRRHGLEAASAGTVIRATLGGIRFSELLDSGVFAIEAEAAIEEPARELAVA